MTREPRVSREHLHRLPAAETGLSPTPGRLWVGPIPPGTCGRSLEWALAVHPPKCRAPTGLSAASLHTLTRGPGCCSPGKPPAVLRRGPGGSPGEAPTPFIPFDWAPGWWGSRRRFPFPWPEGPVAHTGAGLSVGPSSLPRHHPHRARGCLRTREVTEVARALPLRSAGRAVPRP